MIKKANFKRISGSAQGLLHLQILGVFMLNYYQETIRHFLFVADACFEFELRQVISLSLLDRLLWVLVKLSRHKSSG